MLSSWDQTKIANKTAEKGIEWKFNPPGAPHFGGVFESMIKTAKRSISAILKSASIRDEELLTAFTIAEGMINSRPLTYQSTDPKDELPLTPNHFLMGHQGRIPLDDVDFEQYNPQQRYYYMQRLMTNVWKRWMRELLPTLNPRNKWNTIEEDLKVDDIVISIEKDVPRGKWPMGRVLEVHHGLDERIRVVTVLIDGKNVTRPISRLIRIVKAEKE